VLADLHVEKASVEGQQKVAESDLGPVRYLAKMIGSDEQDVLGWFILVIAVLLDPAAVLLLLAATRRTQATGPDPRERPTRPSAPYRPDQVKMRDFG